LRKIGVISDVHGNLPALVAALNYLKSQNCEEIIHTGDVVDIGANSRECLEMLLANNVLCLLGNHDKDYLFDNAIHGHLSHVSARHKRFVFDSLGEKYRGKVSEFPLFAERVLGGKKVVFEHYCRNLHRKEGDFLFKPIVNPPTVEAFDEMYAEYDCDIVFFGHKHEPCDIVGRIHYVDIGSVGCHPEAEATGIVISFDDSRFAYERFSLPYDMRAVEESMTNDSLPDGRYLFDFYFAHKPNMPPVEN